MRKMAKLLAYAAMPWGVLAPISAMAQTANPQVPPATKAEAAAALPEIVVTGTSIRGVAPTGSALINVGRPAIEATTAQTVDQLLSTVPNLGNFGTLATATTFIPVATTPSIHGIGSSATLTLVDGYRFAASGVPADPSIIPLLAVDRLEIVPDGASSIYGSDAVAGVLNLRTRSSYQGVGASAQYLTGDSYHGIAASLIAGQGWDTGSAYIAYDYAYHTDLRAADRSYTQLDQRSRGGGDYRYSFCTPATITIGATTYAAPGLAAGTKNLCDNGGVQDLLPEQTRNSVFVKANQKLTEKIKAFGSLAFSDSRQLDEIAQGNVSLTVPSTNPYFIAPAGTHPTSESVSFNLGTDFGSTVPFKVSADVLVLNGGIEADLGRRWTLTASGDYDLEYQDLEGHGVETAQLQAAAAGTTTATAYNPYGVGPATNPAVLASLASSGLTFVKSRSESSEGLLKLDGPLFALPGGDVKAAFGAEIRHEITRQSQLGNAAQPGGGPSSPVLHGGGPRTIKSVYGELFVPIVGPANTLPLLQGLDLSVSDRYDDYSDVGNTNNPKVGVTWTPIHGLKLRSSWGASFNAPSLADLHAVDTRIQTAPALFGPVFGNLLVEAGGKTTLKPQTADTWSVGFDFQPYFAHGLTLSASYFNISYKDLIAIPSLSQVLGGNPAFAQYIIVHPTAAQIAATLSSAPLGGVVFTPVGTILDLRRTNLGQQITGGVDFSAAYQLPTKLGMFDIGVAGTYLTDYQTASDRSSPLISSLGAQSRLSQRAYLTWDHRDFGGGVFVNYVAPYDNQTKTPVQRVDSFVTVDLKAHYQLSAPRFPNGVQLELGVDNVFDRDPPFYDSIDTIGNTAGYDLTHASPLGRVVSFGVRTRF